MTISLLVHDPLLHDRDWLDRRTVFDVREMPVTEAAGLGFGINCLVQRLHDSRVYRLADFRREKDHTIVLLELGQSGLGRWVSISELTRFYRVIPGRAVLPMVQATRHESN